MADILIKCNRIKVLEGCTATINGNEVIIEKKENKEQEFKDGDILCSKSCDTLLIFKEFTREGYFCSYYNSEEDFNWGWNVPLFRLATEEEKQRLFDKMKEKGYRWNAKEKKVEDIIWMPTFGETYYYVGSCADVAETRNLFGLADLAFEKIHNQFRTREQAEKAAEAVKKTLRKFYEDNK